MSYFSLPYTCSAVAGRHCRRHRFWETERVFDMHSQENPTGLRPDLLLLPAQS